MNAIDGGHRPYLAAPAAVPWDSKEAATAAAAYGVLVGQAPALYPEAPGVWRPTPPNFTPDPAPWVGNVTPFLVPSAEMLRTDGPNALTSAAYAEDFDEVKRLGSLTSTTRTADQTEAAIWWQTTGAFWNAVTRTIVATRPDVDIVENAGLFAMENMAAADGFIGCYSEKYYWQFWRPIAAIRAGDADGNPATDGDPSWTPLFDPGATDRGLNFGPTLFTPPFPDHPSAHSCASSAIVHTMQDFFGTDKVGFSAFSPRTRTTRSFDRLSDALKEVVDARVWGGIHFRTADVQGAVLGKKVAHYLRKHYFQPLR